MDNNYSKTPLYKPLITILMILNFLYYFADVSAQNLTKELSAYTVMGIFTFGDSKSKMEKNLADQEGFECKNQADDSFGNTIFCANEYDREKDFYTFYLDNNQRFYMARIDLVYTGGDLSIDEIYDSVTSNFGKIAMDSYAQGAFFDYVSKGSVSAECGIVNQNLYVCMNGVSETAEEYPFVSVHYALPEFVEAYDSGLSFPFHGRKQVELVDPYNVIGEVFHFGDSGNIVMEDMSSRDGMHCEPANDSELGKIIICNVDASDIESDQYTFYFSDEELLYMLKIDMFYKGTANTIIELFDQVADQFSNTEMSVHNQGEFYKQIRKDSVVAACGEIIGKNMFACVSASEEKNGNQYPFVSLYYADSATVKNVDAGEVK